jgi:hypothetical protein
VRTRGSATHPAIRLFRDREMPNCALANLGQGDLSAEPDDPEVANKVIGMKCPALVLAALSVLGTYMAQGAHGYGQASSSLTAGILQASTLDQTRSTQQRRYRSISQPRV